MYSSLATTWSAFVNSSGLRRAPCRTGRCNRWVSSGVVAFHHTVDGLNSVWLFPGISRQDVGGALVSIGNIWKACQEYRWFVAALVTGLVVRVALAPLGWHAYDMFTFSDWAWQLFEEPRNRFYAAPLEVPGDHLPGDLTIMWIMAHVTRVAVPGFDFFDNRYVLIIKAVPIVCDLLLAVGMALVARSFGSRRQAVVVGSLVALNPAAIMISAVWGQWDSVPMALVVFAVLALIRKRSWLAFPLLACACLFKPQLGVLIPLFAIADLRLRMLPLPGISRWRRWGTALQSAWRGWAAGFAASLAVILALSLPFGIGFPGMDTRYTLFERIQFAAERYASTSHGAYNLWYLLFPETRWDGDIGVFGLSHHQVGYVLFAGALVLAVIGVLTIDPWPVAFAWGGVVVTLAIYMLPTRIHERYVFPAVVFAFLLVLIAPQFRWLAGGLTITAFVGIYLSYSWYKPSIDVHVLQHHAVLRTLALVNLAMFVAVLAWGIREMLGTRQYSLAQGRKDREPALGAKSP